LRLVPIAGAACVAFAALTSGCNDNSTNTGEGQDPYQTTIDQFGLGPLPSVPYPANNPFNAERIALGQLLFYDPILGGESAPWVKVAAGKDPYRYRANDVACATCHHPTFGFADGRQLGAGVSGAQFHDTDLGPQRVVPGRSVVGIRLLGIESRNTPTVLNAAFNGKGTPDPVSDGFQFMDGRALGLEDQMKKPITNLDEMAGEAYGRNVLGNALTNEMIQDSVAARVRGIPEYVARFRQAFVGEITAASDITIDHVARAIGAFERELVTPTSRYDRFVSGDRSALTDVEKSGFLLFFVKAQCGECHKGSMLSDFTFRVQGAGDAYPPGFGGNNGIGGDFGRYNADPILFADRKYAFRVLTIRNVELTAPYFHSGSAGTLRDVVDFYDRGGQGPSDLSDATLQAGGAHRDPSIRPLGLTSREKDAIIAFMRSATGTVPRGALGIDLLAVPERVPSGLVPPGVPTPSGPGPFRTKTTPARH
jgi:cytochrome c peroxidase